MPGEPGSRRKADPEDVLRVYFRQELGKAEANLPCPPPLPALAADHSGYGFRGNMATLLLAACILGTAALALSCSPRAALASSIGQVVEGQGLERLKQDAIKVAGLVWQQGQEYFRQKHSGIVGAAGKPAAEKEKP